MIKKNVKIGEIKNVTIVEMGTGDILIAGIDWKDEGAHGILLSQDKPKDIENWNNVETPIKSFEEAKDPVIIRFTRKESVDQLINSLLEVKKTFK